MNEDIRPQSRDISIVATGLMIVLLCVSLGFMIVRDIFYEPDSSKYIPSERHQRPLWGDGEDGVDAMRSQVEMGMSKAEVDEIIGSPYACTTSDSTTTYSMTHCQYGSRTAEYHFDVTYMNGKVWGTTAVKNDSYT